MTASSRRSSNARDDHERHARKINAFSKRLRA